MASFGESLRTMRGDLAAAMSDLAERYRYEARRRSQLLVRYLPPAFAVVFGVVVLLIALTLGLQSAAEAGLGDNASLTQITIRSGFRRDSRCRRAVWY